MIRCFILFCAVACATSELLAAELSVYYPDYRYKAGDNPEFYGTTNLILFSGEPKEDGSVDFSRIKPEMIEMAKAVNPGAMKVTVSVGGWGRGNIFGKAVETAEKRTRFVTGLVKFCQDFSLNGVDIDWEYPKTEKEHADFTLFLQQLSQELHRDEMILTVALAPTRPLSKGAYAVIDQVNLMSYQPWNPPESSYEVWLEDAIKGMLESGLPPEKLIVGLPFFIKEMGGERKAISWKKLAGEDALAIPASEFGYTPAGREICDLRVRLMKKYGLGGVMIWDFGHDSIDPEHSLLKHLSEKIAQ